MQLDDRGARVQLLRRRVRSTCAWTRREGFTAADLVNRLPERELADVIYRWGEEHASRRIARAIVETRRRRP